MRMASARELQNPSNSLNVIENVRRSQILASDERFPGQYYDAETRHDYNYYRDYDSSTDRYIESDPIGLDGGINTYSYVRDNPLSLTDPQGTDVVLPGPIPLPLPAPTSGAGGSAALASAAQAALNWAGAHVNSAGGMVGGLIWDLLHPIMNTCNDSDHTKCREVKNACIASCSQFGLPSKNGDGVSFRRCVRNCMARQGCYNF